MNEWMNRNKEGSDVKKGSVEWYGKPAENTPTITGDPVICYIVGGTCYAEVWKQVKEDNE